MASVNEIKKVIDEIAPPKYACDWDNTGMNINLHQREVTGVLVCLDVTQAVIREAVEKGCNLILAHHPLLFHSVKTIDTDTYVGGCVAELIKNNISLYCAHTSVDSVACGINGWLADIFGLKSREFLSVSGADEYYKVAVTVPEENAAAVRDAMAASGAGRLGDYSDCTYSVKGAGTFRPGTGANPFIGEKNKLETVQEAWVQAVVAKENLDAVIHAIKAAHPYEMPAIDVFCLESSGMQSAGLGIVGDMEEAQPAGLVLDQLKETLDLQAVRFKGDARVPVRRIAVCGGSGGSLVKTAKKLHADMLITGEVKHNEYLDAKIFIAEAGHYDTEKCFCEIMVNSLQKALNHVQYDVAVKRSECMERPYVDY